MTTRVVHRVRCRNPKDKSMWVDVKIVDGVTVLTPNGTEMMVLLDNKNAQPFIVDATPGGNAKGDAGKCTRSSHMELVVGGDDALQRFYVEILDAIAFQPPVKFDSDQIGRGLDDNEKRGGLPKTATFGKGPFALIMVESKARKYIVDNVGLGLDEGDPKDASRSMHVCMVTEKGNTDDKTDESDEIPPKKIGWLATVRADGVNFKVPEGNICILVPKGKQDEVDKTVLTTDPFDGKPCPPDNTDPNIYVAFPKEGDPNFPSVGPNIHIPSVLGDSKHGTHPRPIDQGPFWWIDKISPGFRPWFWYADFNIPQAFSFFGSPGRLGNWAWRGFVLWNNYPVIWILSRNNAIVPMGDFGSPSLDLCARIGDWDFSFPPCPSKPFQAPGRPEGSTVQFPFSALDFAGAIDPAAGASGFEGGFPNTPGPFGPFGIIQLTHPPLGHPPDAVAYGLDGSGAELWDAIPNAWQLTGEQQPPRLDPSKPWEPFHNPYTPPAAKDSERMARKFEANWNAAAKGHNAFIQGFVPGGGVSNGHAGYAEPPGWAWAVPFYDNSIGHASGIAGAPGEGYRAAFNNGIPPGVATRALPLEIYSPATSWVMKVDQLDPALWDCTHLELYQNPLNAFSPLITPPFLWTNDPWIGTAHGPGGNTE